MSSVVQTVRRSGDQAEISPGVPPAVAGAEENEHRLVVGALEADHLADPPIRHANAVVARKGSHVVRGCRIGAE